MNGVPVVANAIWGIGSPLGQSRTDLLHPRCTNCAIFRASDLAFRMLVNLSPTSGTPGPEHFATERPEEFRSFSWFF